MTRAARAAAVVALLGAVAGCTSSGSGPSTPGSSTPGSSTSRTSAPASSPVPSTASTSLPSGTPIVAASLRSSLVAGVGSIRSAHVVIEVSLGAAAVSSNGDETLRDGRLESIRLTSTLPAGGSFEVRVVDGRTYARLPQSLYRTTRTWVLISARSPSSKIRALAASLTTSLRSASLTMVSQYLAAGSSARRIGSATVGGIATTRYGLLVSVAELPASFPGRANLVALGVRTVPVQLYLDTAGRPVRVAETVAVAAQTTSVTATLSRINVPVTITAPPSAQVGTS